MRTRRGAGWMRVVAVVAVVAVIVVVGVAGYSAGVRHGRGARVRSDVPPLGIHKIRHVIVIMQENRSFDSYFGTYPGADGIPMKHGVPTACLPDLKPLPCVRPFADHADVNSGGPHHSTNATLDVNDGRMDGFAVRARIAAHTCVDSVNPECAGVRRSDGPPDAMGYHTGTDLPNYWTYAHDFVLQDHMFEPNGVVEPARASVHGVGMVGEMHPSQRPELVREHRRAVIKGLATRERSATTGEERPHLRVDRPDLHVARGGRLVGLLRRHRHPTRLRERQRHAAFRSHKMPKLPGTGIRCRTSTPCTMIIKSATFNRPRTSSTHSDTTRSRQVSWVVPSGITSEHPPARISDRRRLRHQPRERRHAESRSGTRPPSFSPGTTGAASTTTSPHPRSIRTATASASRPSSSARTPRPGYIDHQTLSFDAYDKFIEDDFLNSQRLDPRTDGRPDPRPTVRENVPILGDLTKDFDFTQAPRPPILLPLHPQTTLTG